MRAAIRVEIKRKNVKINGENPAPLLAGPARGWCHRIADSAPTLIFDFVTFNDNVVWAQTCSFPLFHILLYRNPVSILSVSFACCLLLVLLAVLPAGKKKRIVLAIDKPAVT